MIALLDYAEMQLHCRRRVSCCYVTQTKQNKTKMLHDSSLASCKVTATLGPSLLYKQEKIHRFAWLVD